MTDVTRIPHRDVELSAWTTMGVGVAATVWLPESAEEVAALADEWTLANDPWFVLGGGSNVVIGAVPEDEHIIHPAIRGIEVVERTADSVTLGIGAGERWDDVVAYSVEHELGGVESLSGIPGSAGAAPVQNIGAYGTELSSALVAIDRWHDGELERVDANDLKLRYRNSALKAQGDSIVVAVYLRLTSDGFSAPIAYAQLARALDVPIGERRPVAEVRAAVIAVRRQKSMVFDLDDPDSRGCGSFFTNPIVSAGFAARLPSDVPRWPMGDDRQVKLSAAWLIEHAGIGKGFMLPGSGASVSRKHTLAITNRGAATAADVVQLATFIQTRVQNEFGVQLQPEPRIISA